jgi:tetratricopeptide (TPR) repeat protein
MFRARRIRSVISTNRISFWGIFWVDADTRQSLEQGFDDIARIQVPPLKDATPKGVMQWLASNKESWLLILDNCDDTKVDFAKYIPSRGGSILITTRLTECRNLGHWENIDELGKEDATHLLLKASGLENGDPEALKPAAESVVSVLGQHALALVHAGAYIKRGYCTLDEYVQSFQDVQNRLIEFKPEQQASRHGSVYTTFEVSARALASSDRHDTHLALRLLNILAFLDREVVEVDVFINAFDKCHQVESYYKFVWEENEIQPSQHCAALSTGTDLATKHQRGLERIDVSQSMTDVSCEWRGSHHYTGDSEVEEHELIEAGSVKSMHEDHQGSTGSISRKTIVLDTFIDHLSKASDSEKLSPDAFDTPGPGNDVNDDGEINSLHIWHCDRVRSSGLVERQKSTRLRAACIRLADLALIKLDNDTISMHPLVHEWAHTRLSEVARQEAWEQALSVLALSSWNMDWTPFTRTIVTHTKACIRILRGEKNQPSLSLNVLRALYQLAECCYLDEQNEVSLAIFETLSGSPEIRPHTWSYKNSLVLRKKAECLGELGRPEQMQSCVDQILQTTTHWFGPDSWEAYSCQMLLADAHCTAGNFRNAVDLLEPLYERISRNSALRELDQREFLQTLSRANRSLGNYERAVTLLLEELQIAQSSLPPDHAGACYVVFRLSEVYIIGDEFEKAVKLLEDALNLDSRQFPRDRISHWMIITLATAYVLRLDEYAQTTPIFETMYAQDLGKPSRDDGSPTNMTNALATANIILDKVNQAVSLLEELVETQRPCLPPDDPDRLAAITRLAMLYVALEQPNQAVKLLVEVVEIERSSLLPDDPERLSNLDTLALAYLKVPQPDKAMTLLEEVVDFGRSRVPLHDLDLLHSIDRLADAYLQLDKPSQAVALLEEVVECLPLDLSEELVSKMKLLARAFRDLNRPHQEVSLREQIVAWDTSHLAEDNATRLLSVRRLAGAYVNFGTGEKIQEAMSLLEEVMEKGKETLHADPEELKFTQGRLGDAQEKLRQISEGHSLVQSLEEQGILNVTADKPIGSAVYQHLRDFTKKAARMF